MSAVAKNMSPNTLATGTETPDAYPPQILSVNAAKNSDAFTLNGELVNTYFVFRSKILFVTFDNLATVGEYDPPQPWLHARTKRAGFSVLGLMATRKDWYRNTETPRILSELQDAGFFERFERVVFVGTSMGGYAALTFSKIVPGSVVLAFSPQTTLNKTIAPFEARFRYGHRKWDWDSPEFLDATEGLSSADEIWLFYDPFIPEDRAHAARITTPNARHVKCHHFGHRLMRQLIACEVLDEIILNVGQGDFDTAHFRQGLRKRRDVKTWRKEFLSNLIKSNHPQLAVPMAEAFLRDDPNSGFARKTILRLEKESAAAAAAKQVALEGEDQAGPFDATIVQARGAFIIPEREHDQKFASGVLLADKSFCEQSRSWIRARKSTAIPELSPDEPVGKLPGSHMFAGHMRGHFGHFLVESTARLWALQTVEKQIDSIIYLPYRGNVAQTERAIGAHQKFFDLLGINVPIQTFGTAMEVENLFVPELGFGWRERYAGSKSYQHFMRNRLGGSIPAQGRKDLYISRSLLPSQRGGIVGETVIEENLAAQGYEIFHPQKNPLDVQISRYKAARRVIALDGSALHLAAFFLDEHSKVAVIKRRSSANIVDYDLQYRSFCGIVPDVIDVIRDDWLSGDAKRADFRSVGDLNFDKLFKTLGKLDFISRGFYPRLPSNADVDDMRHGFAERRGEPFRTKDDVG